MKHGAHSFCTAVRWLSESNPRNITKTTRCWLLSHSGLHVCNW